MLLYQGSENVEMHSCIWASRKLLKKYIFSGNRLESSDPAERNHDILYLLINRGKWKI